MAEENQMQQITKGPQRVTTKNPKKVEVGKRLAEHNCKKREMKEREEQAKLEKTVSGVNQYYGIGAVIALGVIGSLGNYIYQSRKGPAPREVMMPASQQPRPQGNCSLTSSRWIKSFLYYKNGQEEYSK